MDGALMKNQLAPYLKSKQLINWRLYYGRHTKLDQ
jgi:hypothetical protein